MGPRSRIAAAVVAPAAVLLAIVGIAWACTPPAVHVNPDWISSSGQTVTVTGEYFPADSQIDISIEGNGQARYLTSVSGSSQWTVEVTVPADLAEGKYWVYARYETTSPDGNTAVEQAAAELQIGQLEPAEPQPAEPAPAEPAPAEPGPAGPGRPGSGPVEPSAGEARYEQAAPSSAAPTSAAAAGPSSAGAAAGHRSELDRAPALLPKADLLVPEPGGRPVFAQGSAPAYTGEPATVGDRPYLLYGAVLLAIGLVSIAAAAAALGLRSRRAHAGRAD